MKRSGAIGAGLYIPINQALTRASV
eukprot:COSAG03_NODE_25698_length_264_cov_0.624242_1_plen_24_part_10